MVTYSIEIIVFGLSQIFVFKITQLSFLKIDNSYFDHLNCGLRFLSIHNIPILRMHSRSNVDKGAQSISSLRNSYLYLKTLFEGSLAILGL